MRDYYIRQEIIKNYIEAYNSCDIEKMIVDFDENIIFVNRQNGNSTLYIQGLVQIYSHAQESIKLFVQRRQTIKMYRHTEANTVVEVDFCAEMAIDFGKYTKGDEIRINGTSIFEFKNEKIIKLTGMSYLLQE